MSNQNCISVSYFPLLPDGANIVFERVQVWLKEAEEACNRFSNEHWVSIDSLAQRLIKDEVVTGEELKQEIEL